MSLLEQEASGTRRRASSVDPTSRNARKSSYITSSNGLLNISIEGIKYSELNSYSRKKANAKFCRNKSRDTLDVITDTKI